MRASPDLAAAVAQELVQAHLYLEGWRDEGGKQHLVAAVPQKGHALLGVPSRQHIGQGDVLEARAAPHGVIVGNIDARGDSARGKGKDLGSTREWTCDIECVCV